MKKKLLLLTTFLLTAISGAWADNVLYGIMDSSNKLTLYYGEAPSGAATYISIYDDNWERYIYEWSSDDVKTASSVVTDASCSGYNGTTLEDLFEGFSSATSMDLSNLNTSNVTNMAYMFYGCKNLKSLDVSNFNTSKVTTMHGMFGYFGYPTMQLDLSNFNTGNVTDMSEMFLDCSLYSLDLSNFDTSKVTNMSNMFVGCRKLTSLDVSNFNTSKVTTMQGMFSECQKLRSLNLNNFNTSKVTDMSFMFSYCGLTSLDLSNFNTSSVTDMTNMFGYCDGLKSLDVSNFETSKVTSIVGMFNACKRLTSLDLSNFDTSNVSYMGGMFYGCSSLTTIIVGTNWSTNAITISDAMFDGCTSLVGEAGTEYDEDKTDVTYAHIDGGTSNPGYLTSVAATLTAHSDGTDYWTTYCNNTTQAMVAPSATVYTAKLDGTANVKLMTKVPDMVIPAGQAVILKASKASIALGKTAAESAGIFTDNELLGGSSVTSGYVPYTLAKPEGKVLGFYKFTGTLDADKAHLEVASSGSARQFIGIGGIGETTEIGDAPRLNDKGEIVDDNWYTLDGRMLDGKPTQKGVYVTKGKKVIVNK